MAETTEEKVKIIKTFWPHPLVVVVLFSSTLIPLVSKKTFTLRAFRHSSRPASMEKMHWHSRETCVPSPSFLCLLLSSQNMVQLNFLFPMNYSAVTMLL